MDNFYGIIDGHMSNHIKTCRSKFDTNQILWVCLVGSQNYQLATATSDYDSKCCVLPSWKNILKADEPYSHTLLLENKEQINVADFRRMLSYLKKQNINFLEQLYSIQYLKNETYNKELEKLWSMREDIAHYNPLRFVEALCGDARNTSERIFKSLSKDKEIDLQKYGYHPKEYAKLYRVEQFLACYIAGDSFQKCLTSANRNMFLDFKSGDIPVEIVKEDSKERILHIIDMRTNFYNTHEMTTLPAIDTMFDEITDSIFKKYLRQFI